MKSAFLIGLLLSFSAQASEFSVTAWSRELKASLESGKTPSGLLNIDAVQKRALDVGKSPDRAFIATARSLFKAEKFNEALNKYDQVTKGSDPWLEAIEEKGWAFHRQKDFQKALAQTKTLLSEPFVSIVGSEPFFLQSLSQLKICDYKGILETHQLFKKSQRQRLLDIQQLADAGKSSAFDKVMARADSFPLTFTQVGEEAKALPRLFYRDLKLQKALLSIKMAEAGLPVLSAHTNKANVRKTMTDLEQRSRAARLTIKQRLQQLASAENDSNFKILQKINLIEVETIQRIHADKELDRDAFKKGEFVKADDDQMVFPDDGHPWLDELDKYQVRVNSCPQDLRRKM